MWTRAAASPFENYSHHSLQGERGVFYLQLLKKLKALIQMRNSY